MILRRRVLAVLFSSLAMALYLAPAQAAKINGIQCAGDVSVQTNPQTGKKTYACRSVNGNIISGDHVDEKAATPKKEPPVKDSVDKGAPLMK